MTREEAETLVGTLIACVNEAHAAVSYEWRDACWKAADAAEERVVLALTGAQPAPSVPDRITPEQAPESVRDYCQEAAEGYADGWNACIKAMIAATPKPEGE